VCLPSSHDLYCACNYHPVFALATILLALTCSMPWTVVGFQDVLENLVVCRCYNTDHQLSTVHKLAALMVEDGPYSLVIIDSITSLFRVDYVGRGKLLRSLFDITPSLVLPSWQVLSQPPSAPVRRSFFCALCRNRTAQRKYHPIFKVPPAIQRCSTHCLPIHSRIFVWFNSVKLHKLLFRTRSSFLQVSS